MVPEEGDHAREWQAALHVQIPGYGEHAFRSNFKFAAEHSGQRPINKFEAFALPPAGDIVFRLELNGEEKATYRVTVKGPSTPDFQEKLPVV